MEKRLRPSVCVVLIALAAGLLGGGCETKKGAEDSGLRSAAREGLMLGRWSGKVGEVPKGSTELFTTESFITNRPWLLRCQRTRSETVGRDVGYLAVNVWDEATWLPVAFITCKYEREELRKIPQTGAFHLDIFAANCSWEVVAWEIPDQEEWGARGGVSFGTALDGEGARATEVSEVGIRASDLRVPDGFRAASGTEPEPYMGTGWAKDILHGRTGIELSFIPAGEFMMGSGLSPDEVGRQYAYGDDMDEWFVRWIHNEHPQHRVRLTNSFYMGKHEVTQAKWRSMMGGNPSLFQQFEESDELPVEDVSWDECQEFLRKAGNGLSLPTEAEWEYACRAGSSTPYHFGTDVRELRRYAWYYDNSGGRTRPVGKRLPNAWGLYDMHGNVWEWCEDWFVEDYYSESPAENPLGPTSGKVRVIRGGGWIDVARDCRSASRDGGFPWTGFEDCGLRVCLRLSPGTKAIPAERAE
jgi:formylglycine-generating enzyme required for sulfatase activity